MPVRHSDIQVPFVGGVDLKTDRKQVDAGSKLLELENGVFTKRGSIKKRNGYTALSREKDGGVVNSKSGEIEDPRALATRNNELLTFDKDAIYSRSEVEGNWIDVGKFYNVSVLTEVLAKNPNEQTAADCCVLSGISVCAWEDSRGGVRMSAQDSETGTQLIYDFELIATGIRPRVVPINGFIIIFVVTPGTPSTLTGFRIDPTEPHETPTGVVVVSDMRNTTPVYDIRAFGTASILAYSNDAATLTVGYVTSAPALGSPALGFPAAFTIAEDPELAVAVGAGEESVALIGIIWGNTAAGLRGQLFNSDFSSVAAIASLDAAVAQDILNITAAWAFKVGGSGALNLRLCVFYEREEATVALPLSLRDRTVHTVRMTDTGGGQSPITLMRHASLASHSFSEALDCFVNVVHDSPLQSTYFCLNDGGIVLTKVLPGTAGGVTASPHLPSVYNNEFDSSIKEWTGVFKKRLQSDGNDVFTEKGVRFIKYDFRDPQGFRNAQVGETLYVAGGYLMQYDGQHTVEAGFHLFPELSNADLAESTTGSGLLTLTNQYSYRVYYEWVNAQGERERSTTARVISFTLTGANNALTLTIPTLSMTHKRDEPDTSPGTQRREDVSIVIYRSEGDPVFGAPFYRVSSVNPVDSGLAENNYVVNDPLVDTVTFLDELADSVLITNELDYLNSGELDNVAPQAGKLIAQGKDRIFIAGVENPNEVQVSKLRFRGDVVAFNESLSISVDRDGGPITALAVMNDVLLVFKEQRIYAVAGDGPNNLGFGAFNQAQLITTDTGCDNQRSVVTVPAGIMFASSKGIYLITQQFQPVYIGADVEALTVGPSAQTITAATLVEDTNQVRFLVSSGLTLMYDYQHNQWATFSTHTGIDAVNWRGVYTYMRADATAHTENTTSFLDGATPYKLKMVTAWVKVGGGLQEFQRIRRAHVLGEFVSAHQLRMQVGFNYEDAFLETHTFDPETALSQTTYGDSTPYGNEDPYGGESVTVYQLRAFMNRQKCESIRFKFEDVVSANPGASFEITELTLEAARKKGPFKLSAVRSI